jgi:hypothetical protein
MTYPTAAPQPYPTAPGVLDPYDGGQSGRMVQTYGTGGSTAAKIKNGASDLFNSAFPGPAQADTSGLNTAQAIAQQTGSNLGNERATYTPSISPQQQQQALGMLQQAAQGNAPSAAQLQAQQQATQGAANQFGIASALQGGMSGGNALRNAQEGAANLQANVANQNAVLRAQEMAQARGQYSGAIDQARGQDIDWQKALLGGQLQSNQTNATAAGALANANSQQAAATNAYNASPYGMVGNIGKKIFSFL